MRGETELKMVGRMAVIAGALLLIILGSGLLTGFISQGNSSIVPAAAMAMIIVGTGAGLIKKSRREV